jgi:hypothetical protein
MWPYFTLRDNYYYLLGCLFYVGRYLLPIILFVILSQRLGCMLVLPYHCVWYFSEACCYFMLGDICYLSFHVPFCCHAPLSLALPLPWGFCLPLFFWAGDDLCPLWWARAAHSSAVRSRRPASSCSGSLRPSDADNLPLSSSIDWVRARMHGTSS